MHGDERRCSRVGVGGSRRAAGKCQGGVGKGPESPGACPCDELGAGSTGAHSHQLSLNCVNRVSTLDCMSFYLHLGVGRERLLDLRLGMWQERESTC